MSTKLKVTVVVPVRNEAVCIANCLGALGRFDEVIVVDSMSADDTVAIARSYGANVIDFAWNGFYPKKRNWVLLNQKLKHNWVLFVDADEIVSEKFCDELEAAIEDHKISGYWIRYDNYFLGKRLRFGVSQRKLALFRVGAGLYDRVDENNWTGLDMEVHEHPILRGRVGHLKTPVEHKDDRGISHWVTRHLDYAVWEAARMRMLRLRGQLDTQELTSRQKFKYRNMDRMWYPWFYFMLSYIGRFGFLDGTAGLQHALFKAWYFNLIRILYHEP